MSETLSPPSPDTSSTPHFKAFEHGVPMQGAASGDFAFIGGTEEAYTKLGQDLGRTDVDYDAINRDLAKFNPSLRIDNPFEGMGSRIAQTGNRYDSHYSIGIEKDDRGIAKDIVVSRPPLTGMTVQIPENSWQQFATTTEWVKDKKAKWYENDFKLEVKGDINDPHTVAKWKKLRVDPEKEAHEHERERQLRVLNTELTHDLGALALRPEEIFKENTQLGEIIRGKKKEDRRLRHYSKTAQNEKYRKRSQKVGERTRREINGKIERFSNHPAVKGAFETAHILSLSSENSGNETIDEVDEHVPGASVLMDVLQANIEGRKVEGQKDFLAALKVKGEAKGLYAKALLQDQLLFPTGEAYRAARQKAIDALVKEHREATEKVDWSTERGGFPTRKDFKHGHRKDALGRYFPDYSTNSVVEDLGRYSRAFESFERNWDHPGPDEAAANYMEAIVGGETDKQTIAMNKKAMEEQKRNEEAYLKMDALVRKKMAEQLHPHGDDHGDGHGDGHGDHHGDHGGHGHEKWYKAYKKEIILGGIGLALSSGPAYAFWELKEFLEPITNGR